jgi:D-3-phosphoglycerate dehydrogenase / 2-oxoglutarate reductase
MKIVVTEPEPMGEDVRTALKALGEVAWGPFDDAKLADAVRDCEVLMVRLGRFIGESLLARGPTLKFIISATTGLDHIDLEAATRAGVRVISLRDCPEAITDVSATAEHALGLLLALFRRIPAAASHVLSGGWDRNLFWGHQLRGKQLGVVGYGRIGRMFGGYAEALGMKLVAYDLDETKIKPPATAVPFEDLLENSDVISIHVSAVPENQHLIDRAVVARMKPGAVLINTTRGSIVDEAALAKAVYSGRLTGVAVDVLQGEEKRELQSSPLLACAQAGYNVLITPHIGGATEEAIARTESAVIEVLRAAFKERGR